MSKEKEVDFKLITDINVVSYEDSVILEIIDERGKTSIAKLTAKDANSLIERISKSISELNLKESQL
jgi:hypothetical protein